ncbi:MAG: threonylcarbamoyl-AMP synthase [Euryarchaeota archaeon]|nr:threonylcarbamoyl-AMP synthase [Euryarchaeota archaeon]MBU4339635.1 threonylcarbamoyl-AMP synthase [Euryarchaeota archaeon]MBU4453668.1 threonylcarbamoyl-AMP synthase [Euryarchaeota archaeon]MCG2735072.1 threonylcarbamoyl-AMP synthase [Candidatus Methanoperedenaceae archaeon]
MAKVTLVLSAGEIKKAAEIIKAGGTVAFPTETVYGLGANALDGEAVTKIFRAKRRPADNPLIAHISSREMLNMVARDIPALAFKLMDDFWPGALTIVLKRQDGVPDITTGGLDTVAVRMPANDIALALITEAGVPIAAPSANISGMPSPTKAEHVIRDMDGRIDAVIVGEDCNVGVESTVIDLTITPPALLRPGGLSLEDIIETIGEVNVKEESVKSPGMRYTHYSPKTRLILVEGERKSVLVEINRIIHEYRKQGQKAGVIASRESASDIECDAKYILGSIDDLKEVASRLFSGLRFLDEAGVDVGIVEGVFPEIKEGRAIMNRLRKAAGERIKCQQVKSCGKEQ